MSMPGIFEYDIDWRKKKTYTDIIKDLQKIPWIIRVGHKSNGRCSYKSLIKTRRPCEDRSRDYSDKGRSQAMPRATRRWKR